MTSRKERPSYSKPQRNPGSGEPSSFPAEPPRAKPADTTASQPPSAGEPGPSDTPSPEPLKLYNDTLMNPLTQIKPRIIIAHSPAWGYTIRYGWRGQDDSLTIAEPVTMKTLTAEERTQSSEPMILLDTGHDEEVLTDLMDQLWQLGIRPTDIGTPGHLAATQAHLQDIQLVAQAHGQTNQKLLDFIEKLTLAEFQSIRGGMAALEVSNVERADQNVLAVEMMRNRLSERQAKVDSLTGELQVMRETANSQSRDHEELRKAYETVIAERESLSVANNALREKYGAHGALLDFIEAEAKGEPMAFAKGSPLGKLAAESGAFRAVQDLAGQVKQVTKLLDRANIGNKEEDRWDARVVDLAESYKQSVEQVRSVQALFQTQRDIAVKLGELMVRIGKAINFDLPGGDPGTIEYFSNMAEAFEKRVSQDWLNFESAKRGASKLVERIEKAISLDAPGVYQELAALLEDIQTSVAS